MLSLIWLFLLLLDNNLVDIHVHKIDVVHLQKYMTLTCLSDNITLVRTRTLIYATENPHFNKHTDLEYSRKKRLIVKRTTPVSKMNDPANEYFIIGFRVLFTPHPSDVSYFIHKMYLPTYLTF